MCVCMCVWNGNKMVVGMNGQWLSENGGWGGGVGMNLH